MKKHLHTSWILVLAWAALAPGQEVAVELADEQAWNGAYNGAPLELFPSDGTCASDCRVAWGLHRNGCLWEGYCADRGQCLEAHLFTHAGCLEDDCMQRRAGCDGACGIVDPGVLQRLRHRIHCLPLFRRIFGWRTGGSCSDGSCVATPSAALPADPWPDDAAPSDPASVDLDLDEADAAAKTSDEDVAAHELTPSLVIEQGETRSSEQPAPRTSPDEVETTLEQSVPEQAAPEQPEWREPAPVVPRNRLPKTGAETSGTLPGPAQRVLVAERLSDYIKS